MFLCILAADYDSTLLQILLMFSPVVPLMSDTEAITQMTVKTQMFERGPVKFFEKLLVR